jgi:hypothetical protein
MRFTALVALALSSLAVVHAANADAALLVARRCPAACAINCPDVSDAALSIYPAAELTYMRLPVLHQHQLPRSLLLNHIGAGRKDGVECGGRETREVYTQDHR